ncbi:MAG: hypothetical protein AAGB34_10705, partial [Planctomycetota bacterium]
GIDSSSTSGTNEELLQGRLTKILRDIRNSQSPSRFVMFHEFPVWAAESSATRSGNTVTALIAPGWHASEARYNSDSGGMPFGDTTRYVSGFADGSARFIEFGFRNFVPFIPGQSIFSSDDSQRPATGSDYTFANTRFMPKGASDFWGDP